MEPEFWHDRWRDKQFGFHQPKPNPILEAHWSTLELAPKTAVFVPLAGKSLDMIWLAEHGHHVIANELSRIAVEDFFDEQNLKPDVTDQSGFTVFASGPYEIWCGDIFALPASATAKISAIYDRASLIALPPAMRQQYAAKLTEISRTANNHPIKSLLISLEYDQSVLDGPPHAVLAGEVQQLFSKDWQIDLIASQEGASVSAKFADAGIDNVRQTVYTLTAQPNAATRT